MMLAEDIVRCGYTAPIKMDNKETIIRKGMELFLVNQMTANAETCRPPFVPGMITKPDADVIMMNCHPQYSEKGTSRERTEWKIINFLQDFLEELEISDGEMASATAEVSESLAVEDVLQWMTGQAHIPILPNEKQHFKITLKFDHECWERLGDHSTCYPVVNACTCTVIFPVHLTTYSDFRKTMTEALRYGHGLHRI
ncbi:hypothetical protein AMECASPLE_032715 [Ameca splendens]|uniref:HECT domain-containing protein n=1 Tax=Ameca splendens TaxID=208324 RepID=A0ABV0YTM8_9TELE